MKREFDLGLDQVLAKLKEGLNPAQICEQNNIKKQTLDYYIRKLKILGCIQKKGYGVWEVVKEVPTRPIGSKGAQDSDFSQKKIRGHAFIWKIEFEREIDWDKVIKNYKGSWGHLPNKNIRLIFQDRKIWLNKRGRMIIYEPLDFLGKSAFQVKGTAVYEMDRLIKNLLNSFNIPFCHYRFTCSREHYGHVKNVLAKQYNDNHEKMAIRGEDGKVWLWIDDSHSLNELETSEADTSVKMENNFWNSNKKHNFRVNADYILNGFDKLTQETTKNTKNLDYHAENMRSHVEVVKILGDQVSKLSDIMKKIEEKLK